MYTVYLYTCIYHFSVTTIHTVTVSDLHNCIHLQKFVYMCYVERVTPDHLQGVEMPDYTFTYANCMDLLVRVCICVCICVCVMVMSVLLYGAETWAVTRQELKGLHAFQMKCLRDIIEVTLWDQRRNEDILAETGEMPVEDQLKRK